MSRTPDTTYVHLLRTGDRYREIGPRDGRIFEVAGTPEHGDFKTYVPLVGYDRPPLYLNNTRVRLISSKDA